MHLADKTNLEVVVDRVPGAGWKTARGARAGTRKARAGHYQIARLEAVAAGWEPGSDEDDDGTELPRWNATLRTGRAPPRASPNIILSWNHRCESSPQVD